MRLAFVCTDRDVHLPGPGLAAGQVQANLLALERLGHDLVFMGTGDGGAVRGTWRVVRQRGGNGAKELRDGYLGTPLGPTSLELWSLAVNHRLGRTLEEERLRAPLEGVIERLSAWSFAAATFCDQRGIPYVLEVPKRPLWDRWSDWDSQLESAAHSVHAFTASLAKLIVVHSEDLVVHYRSLTRAPVIFVGGSTSRARGAGPRPEWAKGFVLVHAGTPAPFEDLKTIAAAAAMLPGDFSFRRLGTALPDLAWADAAVIPATVGGPVEVAHYLAAGLPLVIPKGSAAAELPLDVARTYYAPGDAASLSAAMTAIRDEIARRPRPPRLARASQVAAVVTRYLASPGVAPT